MLIWLCFYITPFVLYIHTLLAPLVILWSHFDIYPLQRYQDRFLSGAPLILSFLPDFPSLLYCCRQHPLISATLWFLPPLISATIWFLPPFDCILSLMRCCCCHWLGCIWYCYLCCDIVAVLGCPCAMDSFFVLSFWWWLILKLILRRVLTNCLVAHGAMELGWSFLAGSLWVLWSHDSSMLANIHACYSRFNLLLLLSRTCKHWSLMLLNFVRACEFGLAAVVGWLTRWWFWGGDFLTQLVPFGAAAHSITARDLIPDLGVSDNT